MTFLNYKNQTGEYKDLYKSNWEFLKELEKVKNSHDESVSKKIDRLIPLFESFESCHNQTLILGSLDYLALALKRAGPKKEELIKAVSDYLRYIENYFIQNYRISDDFSYLD